MKGFLISLFVFILLAGCSSSTETIQKNNTETHAPESTSTPTVTGGSIGTPQPSLDQCDGLGGTLELQVLVGPSEVVGLEPVAVGSIPFSVETSQGFTTVQGSGPITYQDVLEEEWGTYTVNFDLETAVSGTCISNEQSAVLSLIINMSGEQFVEVNAQGFHGEYPWSGSHEFNLDFPVVEEASAEGEGWLFLLHLNE